MPTSLVKIGKDDIVHLDVRKMKLVIGRKIAPEQVQTAVYDIGNLDDTLDMYNALKRHEKDGKLKNVTLV